MKNKVAFSIVILVLIVGLSVWFLVYRPSVSENKLVSALEMARADDCRKAIPLLEDLLDLPPTASGGMEVRLMLARCRTKLKNYQEALPLWEEIYSWDDQQSKEEAEFYISWIAGEEGRIDKAEKLLNQYLSRYPGSPRTPQAFLALARIKKEAGDISSARNLYHEILEISDSDLILNQVRRELGELNFSILFSPEINGDKQVYTVRSGDSLTAIAHRYNTTPDLLIKMNRLKGEIIHPGQVLKVPAHRFSVVVSKSKNTLQLFYGKSFFKEYLVGTGRNNCSPTGEFTIVTKLVNPPWIHAGETIPPFDPRNILGTRWMGFNDPFATFGIHGTTMSETVGSQSSEGCVRMVNEDVEELFIFLPRGTKVIIEE